MWNPTRRRRDRGRAEICTKRWEASRARPSFQRVPGEDRRKPLLLAHLLLNKTEGVCKRDTRCTTPAGGRGPCQDFTSRLKGGRANEEATPHHQGPDLRLGARPGRYPGPGRRAGAGQVRFRRDRHQVQPRHQLRQAPQGPRGLASGEAGQRGDERQGLHRGLPELAALQRRPGPRGNAGGRRSDGRAFACRSSRSSPRSSASSTCRSCSTTSMPSTASRTPQTDRS